MLITVEQIVRMSFTTIFNLTSVKALDVDWVVKVLHECGRDIEADAIDLECR